MGILPDESLKSTGGKLIQKLGRQLIMDGEGMAMGEMNI